MNSRDKVIDKVFGTNTKSDITFKEFIKAVGAFGFEQSTKGKTSGSRVAFIGPDNVIIMLHKPHCSDPVNRNAIRDAKGVLKLNGYIN
jgi:hypothetical protein